MTIGNESDGHESDPGRTIHVAVEVSRKSWTVGVHAPGASRTALHSIPAADAGALEALVERAGEALRHDRDVEPLVLCVYEAGYEGFWLARRLARRGVETLVLDPASLPISRKAARVKTDRVDARRMVRALVAFDRGDRQAMGAVRVPGVEEEDRRRPRTRGRAGVRPIAGRADTCRRTQGSRRLERRAHDRRENGSRTGAGAPGTEPDKSGEFGGVAAPMSAGQSAALGWPSSRPSTCD